MIKEFNLKNFHEQADEWFKLIDIVKAQASNLYTDAYPMTGNFLGLLETNVSKLREIDAWLDDCYEALGGAENGDDFYK